MEKPVACGGAIGGEASSKVVGGYRSQGRGGREGERQ